MAEPNRVWSLFPTAEDSFSAEESCRSAAVERVDQKNDTKKLAVSINCGFARLEGGRSEGMVWKGRNLTNFGLEKITSFPVFYSLVVGFILNSYS